MKVYTFSHHLSKYLPNGVTVLLLLIESHLFNLASKAISNNNLTRTYLAVKQS